MGGFVLFSLVGFFWPFVCSCVGVRGHVGFIKANAERGIGKELVRRLGSMI